ncbi:MAG: hypothetical protein Q4B54_04595 [Coriobacteriales bacterium]|nr:hypothetical protein [Coriobacteriales bacterium]
MLASTSNKNHRTVALAVVLTALLIVYSVLSLSACYSGGHLESSHPDSPTQATSETVSNSIETNEGKVQYLSLQDSDGKTIVTLDVTNKTNTPAVVTAQDVSINHQYKLEPVSVSNTVIQPGETRSIDLTLDLSSQEGLNGASDVHNLTAQMHLCDSNDLTSQLANLPINLYI